MVKIGPVTPEIANVTTAPFWTRRQKSAYSTKCVDNYWTDLHHNLTIVLHSAHLRSETNWNIAIWTVQYEPIFIQIMHNLYPVA